MSSRAPIGYVAIASNDIATNQGFKSVIPKDGIFNEFVYYYLRGNKQLLEKHSSGTTFSELSSSRFSEVPIPIPPLSEQLRIVNKIEALFTQLDAGVESLQTARAQLKRYRQSLLKYAFEGRLTGDWRENKSSGLQTGLELLESIKEKRKTSGEKVQNSGKIDTSQLKELPDKWVWATLDEYCEITMGQSPPGESYNKERNGTPLINGPVEFGDSAFSKTKKTKFTTKPNKMCKKGDLILCIRGSTTGRMNIAGEDSCIGRGVASIRCEINQSYVNYYIHAKENNIFSLGIGSTFPNVSSSQLKKFPIPIPPLEEQHVIVSKIEKVLTSIDKLSDIIEIELNRTESLRQSILKTAFQGKLVPQDPSDEPVETLLKRIRKNNR